MGYWVAELKIDESIVIITPDGPVQVKLIDIGRYKNQIQLGFLGDKAITIWRKEVYEDRKYRGLM